MSTVRNFTDIGFRHFADAAFPRQCSTFIAAMQRISPNRSFDDVDLVGTKAALSLRLGQSIETLNTLLPFALAAFADAENARIPNDSYLPVQWTSPDQSFNHADLSGLQAVFSLHVG